MSRWIHRRLGPFGVGTGLAAVLCVTVLAGVRYEWWRYPSPADVVFEPVTVLLALAGLIIAGATWAVRLYRLRRRRGKKTWALWILPAISVAAVVSFVLIAPPVVTDFHRAQNDMHKFAETMLAEGTARVGPTEIGGIAFSTIYVDDQGCVDFVDSRRTSVQRVGWMYTAACRLPESRLNRLDKVGEHWYRFTQGQ